MLKIKKIFNLSFPRSGTSSFTTAMQKLGYKTKHWDKLACDFYLNSNSKELMKIIKKYDVFSDFPWPLMYKELSVSFPSAYFVLFERDENEWLNSCLNYFKFENKELSGGNEIRNHVFKSSFPERNEENFKFVYKKHIKDVKNYFKGNNFISAKLGNDKDWIEVCDFLKIPYCNFEKLNTSF